MKSRAFNYVVADAYRVELKTVTLVTRLLKEAGLLTTGARGVNAPDMTPLDAARVTIAMLATDKPNRSVEMVKRFAPLPYDSQRSKGPFPDVFGIADGVTLETALTSLFSSDLESDNPFGSSPFIEIQENNRSARIECTGGGILFQDTERTDAQRETDRRDFLGIRHSRGLASAELMELYIQFYLERRDGVSWEERHRGCDGNGYPLDPAHPWNSDLPPAERWERLREIARYQAQWEKDHAP